MSTESPLGFIGGQPSEQRAIQILESMSDGFVALDREWRCTYVNRAAEHNSRMQREQMLGRPIWEVFPEYTSEAVRAWRRAMKHGVTVHYEDYYSPLEAWFELTIYPTASGINVYARDITAHKQAEKSLREQDRFVNHIAELSPVVLDIFDLETERHSYFSSSSVKLFGYTPADMAQMEDQFSTLVHPEDMPPLTENIERLRRLKDGEIQEFECRVRRRDGQWRWIAARSMVFSRNAQGEPRQIVNAAFDITERKQAEERLRESEERFRRYFELGLIGMALTSPTKGIIEVNDQISEILGYERHELLQMTWAEMTHPDDLAADIANFIRVMLGEIDGYTMDKRFIRKDGKVIDATISVKCLRRADGSVDYLLALLQDVTERKRTEKALQKANDELELRVAERTRTLTVVNEELKKEITERRRTEEELRRSEAYLAEGQRLSHTGSWAWNVFTGDLYWSAEHYRIFGLDPEKAKVSYQEAMERIHPEDRTLVQESFEKAIGEKSDFEVDCRIVRADGGIRYVHSLAHAVFNDVGQVSDYVGTTIDNTQRQRADEDRTQLLRRVMSAHEEERRRIARDLHDEFGQQLTAMTLKLRMLKGRWSDPEELGAALDSLEADARQLDRDINLLVWELRPTSLEDLSLEAALTKYTLNWSKHFGIHVELQASGTEEGPLAPEIVTTLYRIAQEALSNIAKHALATNVDIILEHRPDKVSLIVEDNGVGFDTNEVSSRGDGGFGLTGMRERAALVGGTVEIESHTGEGVTVIVRVPLAAV